MEILCGVFLPAASGACVPGTFHHGNCERRGRAGERAAGYREDKAAEALTLINCCGRSGNVRKTKERETDILLSVDIEKLSALLSCGQATAKKIGEDACARIIIGRRVLYSVSKVQKYLETIAE